jgi:multiple sugar transport system substrate-binding protein
MTDDRHTDADDPQQTIHQEVFMKARTTAALTITALAAALTTHGLSQSEKVTLEFWTHSHPPMIAYNKDLIAEYQKANPNVTINYQSFPTDEYLTKLKAALATGTGPDAFDLFDGDLLTYHNQKQLAPVDPAGFGFKSMDDMKKGWLFGSLEGSTFDGQVYQVPMEFNTFSMFINTDLYKKAGLNPDKDAPKTWADLARVSGKIANLKANPKVEGFKWPVPKLGDVWAQITFEPLLRQYGASVLAADGKSSTINSAKAVAALKTYSELITKYKTGDQNSGKYDPLTPNEDFAQGTLGHWISGPWAIPTLEKKPVWGKFKVVPLPQVNPSKPVTLLYAWGWSVNAASKQQTESWKWLSFLSSKGEQWLDKAGYVQPRLGWQDSKVAKDTPFLNVFLEDMKRGQYTVRSTRFAEITKAVNNMLQRALLQGQTPQAAADQAKKEIDEILR